ncbi:GntR family transcriptional regulator [Ureibacillus galli]|nr:GntR family transcriptional regulator [Ureibacillus galli]
MTRIIKHDLLHNQVYSVLIEMIMKGEFQPGDKLVETKIAKELEVSRGTLREALQMILKDGLIYKEDKNMYIYNPEKKDIFDLYECRKSLESLAAKLAAENITKEQLALLGEIIEKSKEANEKKEYKTLTKLNQQFHDLIDEASHNEHLIQICGLIKNKTLFIRNHVLQAHITDYQDYVADHEKIFLAIKSGDAEDAYELMNHHINRSFIEIKKSINK